MNQSEALLRLMKFDEMGDYVFLHRDLMNVFHRDSERALNDSLARFVKSAYWNG